MDDCVFELISKGFLQYSDEWQFSVQFMDRYVILLQHLFYHIVQCNLTSPSSDRERVFSLVRYWASFTIINVCSCNVVSLENDLASISRSWDLVGRRLAEAANSTNRSLPNLDMDDEAQPLHSPIDINPNCSSTAKHSPTIQHFAQCRCISPVFCALVFVSSAMRLSSLVILEMERSWCDSQKPRCLSLFFPIVVASSALGEWPCLHMLTFLRASDDSLPKPTDPLDESRYG